jgi:hypothetical protein
MPKNVASVNTGLSVPQLQALMKEVGVRANIVVSELDASVNQLTPFDPKLSTIIFLKFKGGAHYTCVHHDGCYYDSTDLTIFPPALEKLYGRQLTPLSKYLSNNLQNDGNHMCGHYCVHFLKHMDQTDNSTLEKQLWNTLRYNNQFNGNRVTTAEQIFHSSES